MFNPFRTTGLSLYTPRNHKETGMRTVTRNGPTDIYLLKVNNKDTGVFIVNFEHISRLVFIVNFKHVIVDWRLNGRLSVLHKSSPRSKTQLRKSGKNAREDIHDEVLFMHIRLLKK